MDGVKPQWVVAAAAAIAGSVAMIAALRRQDARAIQRSPGKGIHIDDLREPSNRADHLEFNASLLRRFPDENVIPVSGAEDGTPVFLVHRHDRVMEVIANHEAFSSNPWVGSRGLVTLNTMEKSDHDRVYRALKKFYSPAAIQGMRAMIQELVNVHGKELEQDGDAFKFSKRLHMHISLNTSGISPSMDPDDPAIDQFIMWNDAAVRLAAPLGGVGRAPVWSLESLRRLTRGVLASIPETIQLAKRIGLIETLKLIDPLKSMFPSFPYTHCWDHPEQLRMVPQYFCRLYDSMSAADENTPAGTLFAQIGKTISAGEAIATAVQLMVNMTTANAIMSFFFRKSSNPNVTTDDILTSDAPLQRNPRRAKQDAFVGSVQIPKGALLLLFMGTANMTCPSGGLMTSFGFGLHHCVGRHLVDIELKLISDWLGTRRVDVLKYDRLIDIDVGNWGFSLLDITVAE